MHPLGRVVSQLPKHPTSAVAKTWSRTRGTEPTRRTRRSTWRTPGAKRSPSCWTGPLSMSGNPDLGTWAGRAIGQSTVFWTPSVAGGYSASRFFIFLEEFFGNGFLIGYFLAWILPAKSAPVADEIPDRAVQYSWMLLALWVNFQR